LVSINMMNIKKLTYVGFIKFYLPIMILKTVRISMTTYVIAPGNPTTESTVNYSVFI